MYQVRCTRINMCTCVCARWGHKGYLTTFYRAKLHSGSGYKMQTNIQAALLWWDIKYKQLAIAANIIKNLINNNTEIIITKTTIIYNLYFIL